MPRSPLFSVNHVEDQFYRQGARTQAQETDEALRGFPVVPACIGAIVPKDSREVLLLWIMGCRLESALKRWEGEKVDLLAGGKPATQRVKEGEARLCDLVNLFLRRMSSHGFRCVM